MNNPAKQVVFFAVGFETTAPANAMSVWIARKRRISNFSILVSHVLVPPAIMAILEAPENRVQGFLGPGHVCAVMGYNEYYPISENYRVPIVITGFEPIDLLEGILLAVRQLESGKYCVENQYSRVVQKEGNPTSYALMNEVFEVCDRKWRGIGIIPKSGLKLTPAFDSYNADLIFNVGHIQTLESTECMSGEILKGQRKPKDCPAFGTRCTPQTPLGATMTSAEGACAAYFTYGRHLGLVPRLDSKLVPKLDSRLVAKLDSRLVER